MPATEATNTTLPLPRRNIPGSAMWVSSAGATASTLRRSSAFTKRPRDSGLLPSMGSVGDCLDNAVIESFWGRMQTEMLNRQRW